MAAAQQEQAEIRRRHRLERRHGDDPSQTPSFSSLVAHHEISQGAEALPSQRPLKSAGNMLPINPALPETSLSFLNASEAKKTSTQEILLSSLTEPYRYNSQSAVARSRLEVQCKDIQIHSLSRSIHHNVLCQPARLFQLRLEFVFATAARTLQRELDLHISGY